MTVETTPNPLGERQPVHTVYGGAHLFKADTARKLGDLAQRALDQHAPDAASFARALGLPSEGDLAATVRRRVVEKLAREPVEDLRIDFEDGYGVRSWEEEDGHAAAAAREVAKGLAAGSLPPFLGIRVKALGGQERPRSLRTLDVFFSTLLGATGGALPPRFVTTLPKVSMPEEVASLAEILRAQEAKLGLPAGALLVELMVETPRAIFDAAGRVALPALVEAAGGRCVAAHFGAYDYTASLDITSSHQSLSHPACDLARQVMKIALAGTGVRLSDGATTLLPIPPHRGSALSPEETAENEAAVHRAWKLSFDDITRALASGYHQGWDLHPAQIPVRYAAVYAFFLAGADRAAARLRSFVDRAARASSFGAIFDDAATGQGLLNYFLRAVNAGALTEDDAAAMTGLSLAELRGRSFQAIVEARAPRS